MTIINDNKKIAIRYIFSHFLHTRNTDTIYAIKKVVFNKTM